jgi:hypothetical protein
LAGSNETWSYQGIDSNGNDFERSSVADDELTTRNDLGTVTRVAVVLAGDAKSPWQLVSIQVKNKTANTYYGKNTRASRLPARSPSSSAGRAP